MEDRITTYLRLKAAAARAQAEAEAAVTALAAQAAMAQADAEGSKEAIEAAHEAIEKADAAHDMATASLPDLTRSRSQNGGLAGLKDNWVYEVTDIAVVPPAFLQVNEALVKAAIKTGTRSIPGIRIFNDPKAYVR